MTKTFFFRTTTIIPVFRDFSCSMLSLCFSKVGSRKSESGMGVSDFRLSLSDFNTGWTRFKKESAQAGAGYMRNCCPFLGSLLIKKGNQVVMKNEKQLPIGKSYRAALRRQLGDSDY